MKSSTNSAQSGSKILVIGLDLADEQLIKRWSEEGYLPNISQLHRRGIKGSLRTSAEYMHLSGWPTLHTGTLPGKHGLYHAYQVRPGEQAFHRTRADECAQPPFWKYLDDAGKQCIIMDAFMDYPMKHFKGIQIINWGTWTWFSEPQAFPSGLWNKVLRQGGNYPAPEHSKVLEVPEPEWLRRRLIDGASSKSKVVRWLIHEYPWDFFYVTFAESHPAGHYLWHYADSEYPNYNVVDYKEFENAMRDVYVAIDKAIGKILRELDDSVTVIITSVDGIGPNYAGCHLLPVMLSNLGLYSEVGNKKTNGGDESGAKSLKKSFTKALRDRVPYRVRRNISKLMPRHLQHQLSMKWASSNIDWGKTKAFCIPNANEGYIRINLQGREPHGLVPQGSTFREFCDEIKDRCQELVNPVNDLPAVRQVICSHDVLDGERLSTLPDVIVTWDYNAKVLNQLYTDICGLVEGPAAAYQTEPYYTGNHRPAAFFIASGPSIGESRELYGGHIVDIAPTLLAMLDVEIPANFDGKVWEDLL